MKLTTKKRYCVYYNDDYNVYNYCSTNRIKKYPELFNHRTPIIYNNNETFCSLLSNSLNGNTTT